MSRFVWHLRTFRRVAWVATIGICVLVVAGGAVRLTGSGLGCDDWPNCNSERFVDVSTGHAAIEQLNRLFSGLIAVPVVLMVLGARRLRRQRPGLLAPSIGVLVSVLGNAVVGGIAVRGDLHPALVQSHFVLAMVSIAFGLVAIRRSSDAERLAALAQPLPAAVRRLGWVVGVAMSIAVLTGTVVTGTGPHAGDEEARRFSFDISTVAQLHSVSVLVTVALALALAWRVQRDPAVRSRVGGQLSAWMFVAVVQGAVGYTQYFTGVPELLVGAHIAGATALWAMTVLLVHDLVVAPRAAGVAAGNGEPLPVGGSVSAV